MSTNETIVAGLAILLGMMVVLIPITGLTARLALRPLMDAIGRYREFAGQDRAQELLERRVALIEEQLNGIDRSLRQLAEASEFHDRLAAREPRPLPIGEGDDVPGAR